MTRGQAPQVSLPLVAPGAPALFEAPVLPVLPSVASVASVARVALVAPRGAAPIALALVASVASVAAVVAQVAPVALWPAWLALEAEAGLGPPLFFEATQLLLFLLEANVLAVEPWEVWATNAPQPLQVGGRWDGWDVVRGAYSKHPRSGPALHR